MRSELKNALLVTVASLAAAAPDASAAELPTQAEEFVVAGNARLEYGQVTDIGANMFGAIREICVRQGERVKTGQVLGRLRDQDLRAELEVFKADSENVNLINQAEAKFHRAQVEREMNKQIATRRIGLVSHLAIRQQIQDTEQARWEFEQARFSQRLLRLKRDQLEAEIHLKEFIAPHDGVVTDIFKNTSEAVTVNDRVMHLVNTDVFRVVGAIDLADAWRVRVGQKVRISPEIDGIELAVEKEVFFGEVVYLDREIDPKTQTCRVFAELKNHNDLLRAGLAVRMEVIQKDEATPKPPAGAIGAEGEGPKPPQ